MVYREQYDLKNIPLSDKVEIEKTRLKILFLDYLIANGFDDKSIINLLEISNKVEDCLSIILPKDRYNQFLIVPEINSDILKRYGIYGIEGCVFKGNLHSGGWDSNPAEENIIAKSNELAYFDAAVAMGLSNFKRCAMYTIKGMPKFFGDCVAYKNAAHKKILDTQQEDSLNLMIEQSDEQYALVADTIERENLAFYLIKRK